MRNFKLTTKPAIAAIFMLSVVFLCGCGKGDHQEPVIIAKSYTTFWGSAMPQGICRYWVKEWENVDAQEFQDSCGMYNVGDTLRGGKKHY